jgi:hypothetical protein
MVIWVLISMPINMCPGANLGLAMPSCLSRGATDNLYRRFVHSGRLWVIIMSLYARGGQLGHDRVG